MLAISLSLNWEGICKLEIWESLTKVQGPVMDHLEGLGSIGAQF